MINPCDKCIVTMMCGELCSQKVNYKLTLLNGLKSLTAAYGHYRFKGLPVSLSKQIFLYRQKIRENQAETAIILSRVGNNVGDVCE